MHRFFKLLLISATLLNGLNAAPAQAQSVADAERARDAAVAANAEQLAPDEFEDAEKRLFKARRQFGDNNIRNAQRTTARAVEEFREAELLAIQATVLADARKQIQAAENLRADKYARNTFERAVALEEAARNALAEKRYKNDTAEKIAYETEVTAINAQTIALIAREKPDIENLVLARLIDLQRLEQSAGLALSKANDPLAIANRLSDKVRQLVADNQRLQADLANSQAYAASLADELRLQDEKLGGARAERRELMIELESQAREREQFKQAGELFNDDEARVLQQADTIVVRVIGLQFASGSSDIKPESENLLRKIERVISIYPGATLVVEGHTDSRGSESLNQQLSQNRAQAILNRLLVKLGIPSSRISAVGYGENKPIANNETKEGRAQNRRIDLLITPAK